MPGARQQIVGPALVAAPIRDDQFGPPSSGGPASRTSGYFAFAISTAKTWVGPNMFERKMIHFWSGEKVTLGSRR